jgi:septation ring formation regulator EzrA
VSQNNLSNNLPSVEKLIHRIKSAEKTQQKEIRITLDEARDLVYDLSTITTKLGKTLQEINENLANINKNTQSIDVRFDGGKFD